MTIMEIPAEMAMIEDDKSIVKFNINCDNPAAVDPFVRFPK